MRMMSFLWEQIAQINNMSDDLKGAVITAIVTGTISIVGFIVTYNSMKKNFKNELAKQRYNLALEKMAAMPYEVLTLLSEMIDQGKNGNGATEERLKQFNKFLNTIYSYGSQDCIRIVALMQKENYAINRKEKHKDDFRMIAVYVLLASQIKYDVTGILVSPEFWYQMRITDYEVHKDQFKQTNNKLVEDLHLRTELKIC